MSYQSESELESNLVKQLINQGFNKVKISDEEELKNNFRNELYEHNKVKLNNEPFTDKEFERILRHVEGKSVFQSAKLLRNQKIILDRDDDSKVYIELFNPKDWSKNRFQVTHQTTIVGKRINRYDVTILINGLPMVQIELKRRGLDFKEAFHQINRYKKESLKGLYRYLQVFVISNGVDTKYFANSDKSISYSHAFFWSDEENKRISKLSDFTESFLDRSFISKVIARYIVVNETDKILMVMRPYQIYAVEALVKRVSQTNDNGYIWHTTGSGKTLTSFKASQILANEPGIKKVFFLVDRKDLDKQTIEEFNKFEADAVDRSEKTDVLVKQIQDITKQLVVTTIQKMANAVKNDKYAKVMEQYKDEKVVFIIDECHRSQFGDMHKVINKFFSRAQYFGFTGTPRLDENRSADGRATADLFGSCLHNYLIKDAINDANVLGFSVEYMSTIKGAFDEEDDQKVKDIDTKEAFMADDRISEIANHIVDIHNTKTKNKQYTAILTVQSIPMLVKYYDKFKEINHNLKITGIFSYGVNEDSEGRDEYSRDSLERIIEDYNKEFSTNYSTDKFPNYFSDVCKRVKSADIDILIVVNMLLTGFDSKKLNTLYVDKNLKYHDLLQAYSRTNRVESDNKPYGNIVCYRNLKKNTDDAICLFSETDNTDVVLMKEYDYYLDLWNKQLKNLYEISETPEDTDNLKSEEEKKKFILNFRELTKVLTKLNTFVEFEFDKEKIGMSEQTYQDFKSKYLRIYDETKKGDNEKESILQDIDFSIELMHTDRINVGYIMNLIKDIDLSDNEKKARDIQNVITELDRADNEDLRFKVDLLKEFLNKVVPNLGTNDDIDVAYEEFEEVKKEEDVENFSNEIGLNRYSIKEYISEYEYSGIINTQDIKQDIKVELKPKLSARKVLVNSVKNFIYNHVRKFT